MMVTEAAKSVMPSAEDCPASLLAICRVGVEAWTVSLPKPASKTNVSFRPRRQGVVSRPRR